MAEDLSFRVKNTLVVNGAFVANATVVNAAAINATSVNTATANAMTSIVVGANVSITTSSYAVGNSTVNAVITSTAARIGNTTSNSVVNSTSLAVANSTTSTVLGTADIRVGNTSVNVVISNTVSSFGGNVTVTGAVTSSNVTASLFTGNVTGTSSNATNLNSQPGSFYTNATNITTGTLPDARLSSAVVNTSGNFTVAGNINFTAANVNFTNINVGANLVTNTTTVFIGNSTVNTVATAGQISISGATINATNYSGTANNANNLGGSSLATVQGQITGNAATAYSNATTFASNATNITTGTLPDARLSSAYVNTTGNFTVAGNINFTAANVIFANVHVGANVDLTSTSLVVGNTTVNTVATAGQITLSGATINATNYSGTANNSNNLGGTAASGYALLSGSTFTGPVIVSNTLSVSNNVTITGNLIVTGTTLYANVTNLDVRDLNITVAKGVASAAAADGAGLTVDTANVTWNYHNSTNSWQSNVNITPAANNTLSLGNVNLVWANLHVTNIYGTLQTTSQPNITANNSTNFAGLSLATVQGQITGNAATAYSNAIAIAANATNLTTGAVPASRLTGLANTGVVINATGFFVNAAYIATIAANSATGSLTNTFTVGTAAYFVANGNVGIGNSAPAHRLRVEGDASISGGIHANNSLGTAGQVLHSNGTGIYWAADDTGVSSVATGSGLTGGPITSTGTVSILANTGIVANATGAYVNAAYIATIAANSSTGSLTNTFTVGTAAYFVANGNVGIANTSPNAKLVVTGTANISGNVAIGGNLSVPAIIFSDGSSLSTDPARLITQNLLPRGPFSDQVIDPNNPAGTIGSYYSVGQTITQFYLGDAYQGLQDANRGLRSVRIFALNTAITFDGYGTNYNFIGTSIIDNSVTVTNYASSTLRVNVIHGLYDMTDDQSSWQLFRGGIPLTRFNHNGGTSIYDSGLASRTNTLNTVTTTQDISGGQEATFWVYAGMGGSGASGADAVLGYLRVTFNSWV